MSFLLEHIGDKVRLSRGLPSSPPLLVDCIVAAEFVASGRYPDPANSAVDTVSTFMADHANVRRFAFTNIWDARSVYSVRVCQSFIEPAELYLALYMFVYGFDVETLRISSMEPLRFKREPLGFKSLRSQQRIRFLELVQAESVRSQGLKVFNNASVLKSFVKVCRPK
jgi:hypothetical protein